VYEFQPGDHALRVGEVVSKIMMRRPNVPESLLAYQLHLTSTLGGQRFGATPDDVAVLPPRLPRGPTGKVHKQTFENYGPCDVRGERGNQMEVLR
jgi:hypothetical protein